MRSLELWMCQCCSEPTQCRHRNTMDIYPHEFFKHGKLTKGMLQQAHNLQTLAAKELQTLLQNLGRGGGATLILGVTMDVWPLWMSLWKSLYLLNISTPMMDTFLEIFPSLLLSWGTKWQFPFKMTPGKWPNFPLLWMGFSQTLHLRWTFPPAIHHS